MHSKLHLKRESKFNFQKTQLQLGTKVEITVSAELTPKLQRTAPAHLPLPRPPRFSFCNLKKEGIQKCLETLCPHYFTVRKQLWSYCESVHRLIWLLISKDGRFICQQQMQTFEAPDNRDPRWVGPLPAMACTGNAA